MDNWEDNFEVLEVVEDREDMGFLWDVLLEDNDEFFIDDDLLLFWVDEGCFVECLIFMVFIVFVGKFLVDDGFFVLECLFVCCLVEEFFFLVFLVWELSLGCFVGVGLFRDC